MVYNEIVQKTKTEMEEQIMALCRNCNREIAENSAFCSFCGTRTPKWFDGVFANDLYKYSIRPDGTVRIHEYIGNEEVVEVPEKIEGRAVTAIGILKGYVRGFSYCRSIKTVIIPDTVVEIGEKTFWNCPELVDVFLPRNLVEMGVNVFENCMKLSYVQVPSSLAFIPPFTFVNCKSLEGVTLFEGLEQIGYGAFQDCTSLNGIKFPASLKKIDRAAFAYCTSLDEVEFGSEDTVMEDGAFMDSPFGS